jgi:hypothetical protein
MCPGSQRTGLLGSKGGGLPAATADPIPNVAPRSISALRCMALSYGCTTITRFGNSLQPKKFPIARCFHDVRQANLIEHSVATLVGQRVFAIALGYEDLNDHDELRHDPMMAVLAGKLVARREDCAPVAGKSTLNRLELSKLEPTRYHKISHNPVAIRNLFVDLFLEAQARAPRQIILDLDATDDPLHGEQEGRLFHGYYDCYCYLPLYVFCGQHLLLSKLRCADVDAAAGTVEEVARIIARIRACWPRTCILLRADSGFARDELMT